MRYAKLSSLGLPGAPQSSPGGPQSSLVFPRAPRGSPDFPEALPDSPQLSPALPGVPWSSLELQPYWTSKNLEKLKSTKF